MISFKKIRYLILAGLVVSLPAQPMGWFDTPWKKIGAGVAAVVVALAGLAWVINDYRSSINFMIAGEESRIIVRDSHELLVESMLKRHRDRYDKKRLNELLFKAAQFSSNKSVAILMKYGADVNVQRKRRGVVAGLVLDSLETPLLVAITALDQEKRLATIKLLMEHGAHLDIPQGPGKMNITAYDYADDDEEIIQLLDEHRRKKYSDNQSAIEREILSAVTSLPKPLTKITAAYAAEYPLMVRRPLAFKQEQEEAVQAQVPMIEAPAEPSHPLSLDAETA